MVDALCADGVRKLLADLETKLDACDNLDGFDAAEWLTRWLHEPVPALGGAKPIDLMRTLDGQAVVAQVLAQLFTGAYA